MLFYLSYIPYALYGYISGGTWQALYKSGHNQYLSSSHNISCRMKNGISHSDVTETP